MESIDPKIWIFKQQFSDGIVWNFASNLQIVAAQ